MVKQVRKLRNAGKTVPEIMGQTCLSKASVYRALAKASPVNTPLATGWPGVTPAAILADLTAGAP
jgi:hypothetical protein